MPFRDREKKTLLSSAQYDDDAADIDDRGHTIGTQHDDEDFSDAERTSKELAEEDREVFEDDYEAEESLLRSHQRGATGEHGAGSSSRDVAGKKGQRKDDGRDAKRKRRRKRLEGESELMYEMEEGGRLTGSSEEEGSRGSIGSSEADIKRLVDTREQKSVRCPTCTASNAYSMY